MLVTPELVTPVRNCWRIVNRTLQGATWALHWCPSRTNNLNKNKHPGATTQALVTAPGETRMVLVLVRVLGEYHDKPRPDITEIQKEKTWYLNVSRTTGQLAEPLINLQKVLDCALLDWARGDTLCCSNAPIYPPRER
jgi:hypothetical protein